MKHLVGHEQETLLRCKSDDIFNALSALNLAWKQGGLHLNTRGAIVARQAVMYFCCHLVVRDDFIPLKASNKFEFQCTKFGLIHHFYICKSSRYDPLVVH